MVRSFVLIYVFISLSYKGFGQYIITKSGANFVFDGAVNVVMNSENFSHDGNAFFSTTSNTYLTGTTNVVISGGSGITFGNLTVNNSSGTSAVTLNRNVNTATLVTFTNGIVVSSTSAYFIFNANSTVTGASDASHVYGPVRKAGTADFIFPVGTASYYRMASITSLSAADTFTARYYYHVDPQVVYGILRDPTLDHISKKEYWTIDRDAVANAKVTLSWNVNTTGTIGTITDLEVARWNGSLWKDHDGTGHTGNTSAGTVITPALVTSFSPFTLASTTSTSLPVSLLSFNAKCSSDAKTITWITSSEVNNDHFILERSKDGKEFKPIASIKGNGTISTSSIYTYSDSLVSSGTVYYRLAQYDFDNTKIEFGIISLNESNCQEVTNSIDGVFNIPDGKMVVIYSASERGEVNLSFYSVTGAMLHNQQFEVNKGANSIQLNTSELAAGIYFLSCQQRNKNTSAKFALMR